MLVWGYSLFQEPFQFQHHPVGFERQLWNIPRTLFLSIWSCLGKLWAAKKDTRTVLSAESARWSGDVYIVLWLERLFLQTYGLELNTGLNCGWIPCPLMVSLFLCREIFLFAQKRGGVQAAQQQISHQIAAFKVLFLDQPSDFSLKVVKIQISLQNHFSIFLQLATLMGLLTWKDETNKSPRALHHFSVFFSW